MRCCCIMVLCIILMLSLTLSARDKITLAVLDFEAKNTTPGNAEAVTDLLRTNLFNTGRFTVVERERIRQIFEEQRFQMGGFTDTDKAVEIGKVLNVQKIMLGTVNKLGDTYILNTRMVDVQSGAVDLAVSEKATGGEANLLEAIEKLSITIVVKIGLEGAVIRLSEDIAYIDLGTSDGVRLGQVFDVLRTGETIRDLEGRVIGTKYDQVGSLEVTNVEDGYSEARVRDGAGVLKVGDKARSVATEMSDLQKNYPVEGVWYRIEGVQSGNALDVKGAGTMDGANVQLSTWHGGANQLWMVTRSGAYYRIISKNSGKCLDVKGASKEDGANIQQSACHGSDNQLWRLEPVGEFFRIISKNSGKCMDVKGASKETGANVQQYKSHGGANQWWRFIPE